MRRHVYVLMLAGAAALLLGSQQAGGQESTPPPRPEAERAPAQDTAHVRARLARILEHLEESAEKVRAAIASLDDGATVDEAVEQLGGPVMVRRFAEAWERWNAPRDDDRRGPPDQGEEQRAPVSTGRTSPQDVMAFLEAHAPGLAERLKTLQSESPRGAEAYLDRLTPRVGEILAAREHDPALGAILTREFQVWMSLLDAAGQYAKARRDGDESQAEEVRSTLRELAAEQVDLRRQRRQHEVDVLAERLESLRKEIEEQEKDRDKLIDQLVERTTSERWRGEPGEERRRRRGERD